MICALHQMVLCNLLQESLMEGHVAPMKMLKMNRQFSTKRCMEVSLGSSTSGIANLWYACPKWLAGRFPWHAALSAVPIFFFFYISFARPAPSYCEKYVCMCMYVCIYIYIYIYIYTHTYIYRVSRLEVYKNTCICFST